MSTSTPVLARTAGRTQRSAHLAQQAKRERRAAWLFLLPDSLGLLVFVGLPMVLAIALGFFRVDGFGNIDFIGGANYVRMVGDPQFWSSVRITLIYLVTLVPLLFAVGLALALLVQQKFPFVGAVRSALFVPYAISLVVVAMVWQFMLGDRVGIVNQVLSWFGVEGTSFLGQPSLALATLVFVTLWFQMGYYMVIFLAGLQDIPGEYYEAARIDGAGAWQRFRAITFPLLRPTSFFVLITSTVAVITGGLDLVFIMTKGGPAGATSLLIYYIYEQAFLFGELGYAAAIGSTLIAVLLIWSGLMFLVTKGGRFDDGR
ncbi:binding-protein-dependent transport systems inner membrane component [Beutenbergia cavernae DSM 12333]|uniref:Binding-protein-dependent transport systems inner membrane component n=1 Tax=Beutenbergia cavernae (strain ATCC BAA-8 / DSM 12333 / CCUG 43141 / JCM 11478 / NBRC 16432 / NCIMB 13614 / HKI 0122) TaxID=471853 RepID=C5C442_BEUC1|nr:sugar ABC transporter permease [Beutenbergia cavernae]ACQ79955.1 binding-protein-dependent transport systems inner membrane component [Beutenbergia cavernae DSM 12333]